MKKLFFILVLILSICTVGCETSSEVTTEEKEAPVQEDVALINERESEEVAEPTPDLTNEASSQDDLPTDAQVETSSEDIAASGGDVSLEEENALSAAIQHLKYSAYSYDGLIEMLLYDEYPEKAATYAADNCGADWNEQALGAAENHLKYSAYSYSGLIGMLTHDGFSEEQAVYGADNCKADWNEQALGAAINHLKYSAYSYSGLIDMLIHDGFTEDQATYGADNCKADWNEQALLAAQSHLKYSSYSRDSLIDMLIYDGFTSEQAEYGASESGF
ncbi:MAG: Ltp family lipoprotein [Lachnospiraceae bacterium]|nr:Ltp family lipoprotein [Lachnospiraceae bacterium]